ncbi:hypothetical protein SLINC_4039 [Streptomyces lincolnensis]|uniref:Uncharacterized protein n=1 Tax=Streptomyces lincolnensis TaxID=1915 RepID=A0A1B1MCP5_STRLN|nr:hypothetical protein [Streptomyces lincolnensis]ANS66263.1 hypothetical protein SLINC_4039 [Streptomyces lincolnensis]AXG55135.1 hypothetical protein SLCG_3980 [Streptomyces lincolnensis]QMV08352.1 hypothetical protein GJU35_23730 [Streptomyces lincolnensis]
MTPQPSGSDHLPVYESLVRERGDAVAEARVVSEQAQHEASQALNWHGVALPEPASDTNGGQL